MPFIGKDWRAPGETWIRVSHTAGWELSKLRPVQLNTITTSPSGTNIRQTISSKAEPIDIPRPNHPEENDLEHSFLHSPDVLFNSGDFVASSADSCLSITQDSNNNQESESSDPEIEDSAVEIDDSTDLDDLIEMPHCKVKTGRYKEFIGCTSMSEALHRLDFARAVSDVRRFNYVCKVVQIIVNSKLQNISATARKHLFAIVQAIVLDSVRKDIHLKVARDLLHQFNSGLNSHVCGSPQLVHHQHNAVASLLEITQTSLSIPDSSEESMTFLDLPREILSQILRRLPDHLSLLEAAKAHETLNEIVEHETRQWHTLIKFHFTETQIENHQTLTSTWRHLFFELKKYYGLREVYTDLIHICCHCRSLFWKNYGHPCVDVPSVSTSVPSLSVTVTPQQFVDMLTWF